MMDVVNRNIVFEVMKREALPVYYIYSPDKKSLYSSQEDSSKPVDQCIEQLNFDLNDCLGRYVIVEIRAKNSQEQGTGGDIRTRKIYSYKVSCANNSQQYQQPAQSGIGSVDQGMFMQFMTKISDLEQKLIQQQFEFREKELMREMKEIKSEAKNPMIDQVVNALANKYMQTQRPQSAPIAGAKHEPDETANVSDVKTRAKQGLINLKQVDPTFEGFLKISEFAAKNPEQFKLLLSHVENQNNG